MTAPEPSPRPRRLIWTIAQLLVLAGVLAFAARTITEQQDELATAASNLRPEWTWILLAAGVVLLTYAALIQSWRWLMTGWGSTLPFGAAVRIWTIANLGRLVPGKVWSVGALAVLARREGVSPQASAGAALLGTLLNIGAGFGVVAFAGTPTLQALGPGYRTAALAGAAGFAIGVVFLPWLLPPAARFVARLRGGEGLLPQRIAPRVLWSALAVNIAAWVGYGVAFALFSRGITPSISGALPAFIAVYAASYLAGYLALLAPGGIGVREGVLIVLLPALGMATVAEATVLAIASRLWITILEVLPGLISLALAPSARRTVP